MKGFSLEFPGVSSQDLMFVRTKVQQRFSENESEAVESGSDKSRGVVRYDESTVMSKRTETKITKFKVF